ncbi:MAG: ROK family protein [Varibaculum sp.]|nr:ROK family protein [Varibaculum sp.]
MKTIGIDVGGSGIKAALVDLGKGEFIGDRVRIPTPQPSTPEAVVAVFSELLEELDPDGEAVVGVCFPAPLPGGTVPFIANLDQSWVGVNLAEEFTRALGRPVTVLNDADAAGVAEMHYGVGKDRPGTVLLTTLGTGIGTALFIDGKLVPNTELGHIQIRGVDAETRTSAATRKREDLGWKKWAKRLQQYYSQIEILLSPDLILVGGGVSRNSDKFLPLLNLRAEILPAELRNTAGIVGAAWWASQHVAQ